MDYVQIFCENCAGQFESVCVCVCVRTVSNVGFTEKDFHVTMDWNFLHLPMVRMEWMGVWASIKRTVWKAVKGRKVFVNTAKDFYSIANKKCKGINILYVSEDDVNTNSQNLEKGGKQI